jgi:putative endonuclease
VSIIERMATAPAQAPRTRAQQAGDRAERFAAGALQVAGWEVIGRNVHVGRGEIDILAIDPGPPRQLVAVEVRWRARRDFGLAEETFDFRKRGRLRTAIGWLLERGCLPDGSWLPRLPVRIDLVVIEPPERRGGKMRMRHHRYVG